MGSPLFLLIKKEIFEVVKYKNPLIYAYKKRSSNKIVYVGQTIDLKTRHKAHIEYDPYNPNTFEYNYPLSRGVRKYGKDEYELIILEDSISLEELNDKEIYYIELYRTYHDGYNQDTGGNINDNFYIYTDEKIEDTVNLIMSSDLSFPQISKITGLSMTHLYNLNHGLRRRKDGIFYPLRDENYLTRGQKLTLTEVEQIKDILKNTRIPISKIAEMYNCTSIAGINVGRIFKDENDKYPLRRKRRIDNLQLQGIIKELTETDASFKVLGKKYNISESTIGNINQGIVYKTDGVEYPIRNNKNK